MLSYSEIRETVNQSTIGFEAEGRILDGRGQMIGLPQGILDEIQHTHGQRLISAEHRALQDGDFIYGALELKTKKSINSSDAISFLLSLRDRVERSIATHYGGAKLVFDAHLANSIGVTHPHEIGTQLHIGLRNILFRFFPPSFHDDEAALRDMHTRIATAIAYLVQQDLPTAVSKFCYSSRIASLICSGVLSPSSGRPLPLRVRRGAKSGAVVYRPNFSTIECCTPDSTLNPEMLEAMVEYYRDRIACAIGYLLDHPAFTVPSDQQRFHERWALIDWVAKNHRMG